MFLINSVIIILSHLCSFLNWLLLSICSITILLRQRLSLHFSWCFQETAPMTFWHILIATQCIIQLNISHGHMHTYFFGLLLPLILLILSLLLFSNHFPVPTWMSRQLIRLFYFQTRDAGLIIESHNIIIPPFRPTIIIITSTTNLRNFLIRNKSFDSGTFGTIAFFANYYFVVAD